MFRFSFMCTCARVWFTKQQFLKIRVLFAPHKMWIYVETTWRWWAFFPPMYSKPYNHNGTFFFSCTSQCSMYFYRNFHICQFVWCNQKWIYFLVHFCPHPSLWLCNMLLKQFAVKVFIFIFIFNWWMVVFIEEVKRKAKINENNLQSQYVWFHCMDHQIRYYIYTYNVHMNKIIMFCMWTLYYFHLFDETIKERMLLDFIHHAQICIDLMRWEMWSFIGYTYGIWFVNRKL